MASVDENVVKLSMDDSDLDKGTKRAINDLDSLKKALEFQDAERGLEAVTKAAARVDMSPLSNGIANVSNQFNLLNTIATSAIFNVTNKAIDAGERLVKSLSVDQISAGWSKFADKTSAVQTIMASTSNQFTDTGEQMEYVEGQLEKLNWFTDETSYRFLDMVSNIGKFTASNIALDKSVDSMQGIAAWAARSGAGVQGASRAMYNLSQSMAMGAVRLQDWMSIENANMATYEFKKTALDTAVELGVLTKAANGLYSTLDGTTTSVEGFRESLQKGWFTADVLVNTLDKYGGFATELNKLYEELDGNVPTTTLLKYIDDFVDGSLDMQQAMTATGLSAEELGGWLEKLGSEQYKLGRESFKAAQETKTFQEAIDYVKESVSSGWMRTFEMLFGNYEEAKEFFSNLSEWLYDIFVASGDARNGLLAIWKDDGGREKFIEGLYQIMDNISTVIDTVKKAWQSIFPPATADDLMDITDGFRRLIDILTPTEDVLTTIGNLVRMLATVLRTLKRIVSTFARGLYPYLELLNRLAGIAMNVVSALAEFSVRLMNLIFPTAQLDEFGNSLRNSSNFVTNVLNGGLDTLVDILAALFHALDVFFTYVEQNGGGVAGVFKAIMLAGQDLVDNLFNIETVQTMVSGLFGGLGTLFGGLLESIQEFVGEVMGLDLSADGGVKGWLAGVSEALENTDISGKLSAIVVAIGNVIGALLQFVGDLLGVDADIRGVINDLVRDVTGIFNWIVEQLSNLTLEDVKNVALVVLLGEIVFSLKKLLLGLNTGVGELTKIFKEVKGLLSNLGDESISTKLEGIFSKTKWLQIALAIGILVSGLLQLSRVPKDQLYQGVVAIVAVLGTLLIALKIVEKMTQKGGGKKTIDEFVKLMSGFGIAIGLMGMAVAKLASVPDPTMIWKAVLAIDAIMASLFLFAKFMQKMDGGKFAGIAGSTALLALGITALAVPVVIFAKMDIDKLAQGVTAVAALMVAFGFLGAMLENVKWSSLLAASVAMLTFSTSLAILDIVLATMMKMVTINKDSFETAATNLMLLVMIFGAFNALMTAATGATDAKSILALSVQLIAFASSIAILAGCLKMLGEMDPNQFTQGMVAIGAGIAVLAGAIGLLILIAEDAGEAIPVFLSLAVALAAVAAVIASVGIAAAGIGTGVDLLVNAFKKLIIIGAQFGDQIPEYVNKAMKGVEIAVFRILEIIALSATPMFGAALALFSAIVAAATAVVPDIVAGVMTLITEILEAIAALGPPLMQALTKALRGITDNMDPLFYEIDRFLYHLFKGLAHSLHNLIGDILVFISELIFGSSDWLFIPFDKFISNAWNYIWGKTEVEVDDFAGKGIRAMEARSEEIVDAGADAADKQIDKRAPETGDKAVDGVTGAIDERSGDFEDSGSYSADSYFDGFLKTLEERRRQLDSDGLFNFGRGGVFGGKSKEEAYTGDPTIRYKQDQENYRKSQIEEAEDYGWDLGDGVGSGIGSGLASSTAPAAAARSQAQNIGDAFTDEINKLDLADKTANSLLSLWKAQNPNATEAEQAAKEMELIAGQIVTQSERARYAQLSYTETLEKMGEAATETQEAYIKMIDEQTKLIELQNKLNEAQMQGGEQTTEAFQKMGEVLQDYYYAKDGGRSTAEFLKSLGFTDREIAEAAAKEAGYAIPKIVEDTKDATVDATTSAGQQTVQLYAESVTTNLQTLTPTFTGFGNTYAGALGTGMTEKTDDVGTAAVKTLDGAREEAGSEEMIGKWTNLGYQLDMGIIEGIKKGSGEVAEAVRAMIRAALNAGQNEGKVHSPSRVTEWQASMWVAGYVNALEAGKRPMEKAIITPIKSSLNAANAIFKDSDFTKGFAKSMIDGVNESGGLLGNKIHSLLDVTEDELDSFADNNKIGAQIAEIFGLEDEILHVGVVLDLDDSALYGIDAAASTRVGVAVNQNGSNSRINELQQSIQKTNARMSAIEERMNPKISSGGESKSSSEESVQNFNFTQNNYSPKALSRVDIYRDTKTLMSQFRNHRK